MTAPGWDPATRVSQSVNVSVLTSSVGGPPAPGGGLLASRAESQLCFLRCEQAVRTQELGVGQHWQSNKM